MYKIKEKIGFTLSFSIFMFIMYLITTFVAGALVYICFVMGILTEDYTEKAIISIVIILIVCIILGVLVSTLLSKSMLKGIDKFIKATNRLSHGDFSARLDVEKPPNFKILAENFNKMAEELGGIEVLRTDFINNFSHEFKTPIISIKGFAEILKYDDLSKEERDEYLDIIIKESKRLTSLATNVLNLSKIETQNILKDTERFNIGEQIRQSILILDSKFQSKNILLDIKVQDCYINGNKEMLNQVWLNLLENTIKFNKQNGVVTINVKKQEENIVVVIADTGIGIDKVAINKIFDKFYQEDTSHATKGNGLGLTIVKKIIALHRGTIECESVVSKGTSFRITLPIEKKI